MKVCVTGVAGFLGSWLAEALLAAGHEVVGMDSLIGGEEDNIPNGCDFSRIDVVDRYLDVFLTGCDIVYHCAALAYEGLSVFSPSLIAENVVVGSVNVMVAAIRSGTVKRIVSMSSMARYGQGDPPFSEWHDAHPVDPYGVAKLAAEKQLNILGKAHGIEVVHCVPHNLYGPRQRYHDPFRNVAAIMVNRMLQGQQPVIYGDGSQVRCFSYIADVVPVLVQLLTEGRHGEVFNVGPDEGEITISALAWRIADLIGFELDPIHVEDRPCEVKVALCCAEKIRRRFGYEARTSLDDGLRALIEYVRQRGPRPFDYHLPIELPDSPRLPRTWRERLL